MTFPAQSVRCFRGSVGKCASHQPGTGTTGMKEKIALWSDRYMAKQMAAKDRVVEGVQQLISCHDDWRNSARSVIRFVQIWHEAKTFRRSHWAMCRCFSRFGTVSHEQRDGFVETARLLDRMSRDLFAAAELVNAWEREMRHGSNSSMGGRVMRFCMHRTAAQIEDLACMAEDAAETLALGASSKFTKEILKELNSYPKECAVGS